MTIAVSAHQYLSFVDYPRANVVRFGVGGVWTHIS